MAPQLAWLGLGNMGRASIADKRMFRLVNIFLIVAGNVQ